MLKPQELSDESDTERPVSFKSKHRSKNLGSGENQNQKLVGSK